jgi:hypothetical protein
MIKIPDDTKKRAVKRLLYMPLTEHNWVNMIQRHRQQMFDSGQPTQKTQNAYAREFGQSKKILF